MSYKVVEDSSATFFLLFINLTFQQSNKTITKRRRAVFHSPFLNIISNLIFYPR